MNNRIVFPVLIEDELDEAKKPNVVGGPASFDKLKGLIDKATKKIDVDSQSLQQCLESVNFFAKFIKNQLNNSSDITVDEISMKLAISATGKVGFMGTGVDMNSGLTIDFKFKIKNDHVHLSEEAQ